MMPVRAGTLCNSAAIAALCLCTAASGADGETIADLFGGRQGCALLLTRDRHQERSLEFGGEQCALPLSPCSTFKVPNALIGLQLGVLTGPEELKKWDGQVRGREALNRDHTLASAMRDSVVWYFQDVARRIGEPRMHEWLQRLDYGNADTGSGIDRFWLGGSLEISALEQLELLKKLTHGTLPIDPAHQATVRMLLRSEGAPAGRLFGKTGSCLGDATRGRPDHGWYMGWLEHGNASNPATSWFVVNLRGEAADGPEARRIAFALLDEFN